MKRDYYEVLGVPRDADIQQIKKAYRKLARQHHPDVNTDDPNCEEKFKEATEAYEVLCDDQKRQTYDAYGHDGMRRGAGGPGGGQGGGFEDFGFGDIFENLFGGAFGGAFGGGGGGGPRGPAPGDDLGATIDLTLEEAAFGVERDIDFTAFGSCDACEGVGSQDPSSIGPCPECGGSGRLRVVRRTILGQMVQTTACLRCAGTGRIIGDPCQVCNGAGRVIMDRKVRVKVPAGIDTGQRIRVSGRGGAGERGARSGDLYVSVNVLPHEDFERHGDDILYETELTMVQAALGETLTIPTLDGDEEVEFAAGIQPGEIKVLRGKGVTRLHGHGRGDQVIQVKVLIPYGLDADQEQLLRQFDESSTADQYAPRPEGVLHKLKNFFTGQ